MVGNVGSGLMLRVGCADVDDISYGMVVPVVGWFEIGQCCDLLAMLSEVLSWIHLDGRFSVRGC